MKFIEKSYSLYAKDIHQIWCRSAKFLWKSKFCSESGSGSGSWYYFGFKYQTYISYIEDTHRILFRSANSFKSYCVHMKSTRTYVYPDRQTDGNLFGLFCLLRYKNHKHLSKGENFFFHSCDYNTFSFYILRIWWESKNSIFRYKRPKRAVGALQVYKCSINPRSRPRGRGRKWVLHFYTSSEWIACVASCIEPYFSLQIHANSSWLTVYRHRKCVATQLHSTAVNTTILT